MTILAEATGAENYGLSIRAAIRGLWLGVLDMADFSNTIRGASEWRLRQAWLEGAAMCGILPEEMTSNEQMRLASEIQGLMSYIPPFAQHIIRNSKAKGGKLGPLLTRGQMWTGRYEQFRTMGQATACADRKLKWVLGPTEHCSSCLRLNGKVKRGSVWHQSGILPRVAGADYLACHGYRCLCSLIPTTQRATPGPMPSLP